MDHANHHHAHNHDAHVTKSVFDNLTTSPLTQSDVGSMSDFSGSPSGLDVMDHSNHDMHQHHNHHTMDGSADGQDSNSAMPVAHAHSGHSGGVHDMMMSMSFHFGFMETILFSFWKIDSFAGLLGSMIGIFLMSMLYEGLKVFREYLLQRSLQFQGMGLNVTNSGGAGSSASSSNNGLRVPLAGEGDSNPDTLAVKTFFRPNPFSISHFVQTVLHMIQMFISYLLMLIFMTYNIWLCMAVVLGAGCGYFAFGWRKRTIIDINEHCH